MANNAAVKPGNRAAAVLPYLQWGEDDPTVVPTAGSPGYIYFRIPQNGLPASDVGIYIKINTEGTDTNWILATTNGQIVTDYKDPVDTINPIGTNINLAAPGASINGVVMAAGMSFLVVNQTLPEENGIYDWNGAAVPATRRADANLDVEVTKGMFTWVNSGPTQRGLTGWILTTSNPIILGVTPLSFALCPPIAGATTRIPGMFFVASNGTDANPSTRGAIAAPFATIQAAINQAVAEGYNQSNQMMIMVMPNAATYAGFSTSPGINVSGMILNKFMPRVDHATIVPDGAGANANTGCSISNLQLNSTTQASLDFPAGNVGRWTINNCRILNSVLGLNPVSMDNAGSVLELNDCAVVSNSATPAINYLAGGNLFVKGGVVESQDICILNSAGVLNVINARIQSSAAAGFLIDNSGIIQALMDNQIYATGGAGGLIVRAGGVATAVNNLFVVNAPANNYEVALGATLYKSLLSMNGSSATFLETGTIITVPLTGVGYNPVAPTNYPGTAPTDMKPALDSIAEMVNLFNPAQVYVDVSEGSDVTGTGAKLRPFQSIPAALAYIAGVGAGSYILELAPGNYAGAPIAWPNNVGINAPPNTCQVSHDITMTAAAENFAFYASGVGFNGTFIIDMALATSANIRFQNSSVNLQRIDSNASVFLLIANCGIGGLDIVGNCLVYDSLVVGNVTVQAAGNIVFRDSTLANGVYNVIGSIVLICCNSIVAIAGAGSAFVDSTSYQMTALAGGSITVASQTLLDDAATVAYAPAVPASWLVVPTQVKQALDELIARVIGAEGYSANAYFVAENGNDLTGNGSYQKPYATIQAAITQAVADGHDFADQANILVMPSSVPYAGFTAENGINVIGLANDNKSVIVGAINVTFDGSGFATNAITLANLTITTAAAQAIQVGAGNAGSLTVKFCRVIMTGGFTCVLVNNAGAYVEFDDCYVDGGSQTALQIAAGSVSAWNTTYFISTATAVVVQGAGDFFAEYCSILSSGGGTPALDHQSGSSTILFSKVFNSSAVAASPAISVAAGSVTAANCVLTAQGANENVDVALGATFNHSLCTFAGASSSVANAGTITDLPVFRKRPGKETITLDAGMIAAQQVDLAEEITANSLTLLWSFAQPPLEGDDYTLSTVAGVTRITFVPGGVLNTLAVAGQKLQPGYLY